MNMEINVQFVKLSTNEVLEEFVRKKLNKLSKKYNWIIRVDIFFKEEKKSKVKGKICEMQLSLYGPRIFASAKEETFEAASDQTIRDLEKQLKKRKKELKPYS